ncbi:hypothetical protein LOTGIDRAFT_233055 [Lottia gigantea]|uniref:Sushi, von Willebrand factor type A, EGF and pentraxin domain-containing protein 1 n=1 Tax=Lottia gigantea TaxID=225164 RepID=V4AGQ6_LOTGI|nr:hypothetical protein LOTGIDRAFT_233055 [Lottia gigantea]ESO92606.1 hypothetical protein LOTGIDRAFT_233055 [Lottia gigantea]
MVCCGKAVYLLRLFILLSVLCCSVGYMRDYYNSLFRPMSLNKAKVETLGNILKRHVQALRDTENRKVDLVFLVDSSASVGATNFFDELKFVRKLLADFTVDVNATRVSVITFSSRGKVIRHVDHLTKPKASNQKCGLLADEMPKIRYIGGGTYTLGAFIEAKNVLRAARSDSAKAIFLITDGFSNGGDPRPEATELKKLGLKIFTFGIKNGNVRELYDMSSDPKNETCYILDSFEEFEALARRALHEDLHSGSYVTQSKSSCSSLCKEGRECCHLKADCMCGTHTGKYECLCQPGYYGHGLGKTGCAPCPSKTYKNFTGAGDIKSCSPCPDDNHVSGIGATDISECTCRKGYHNTTDTECAAYRCPMLEAPINGYFVNSKCNNVFNAACGLKCRPGYELRGSSLRICQEDSTWSGTTTGCIMKTCPPLSTPKHGHMICSRDDFTYSTECRFTCDNGFKLVGSRKRSCLAIALWTGINTRCREITCQPLAPLRDGLITPAGCTAGEVLFGTTCLMTCLSAYTLYGPSTKQCTPGGNWAPPSNVPNQCVDENPPFIQCPKKLVVDADPDEPETLVSWQLPLAVDNSGLLPRTTAVPALESPAKLPIGYTTITYIAEDWNKNKAKCKIYIHVVDKTPPRVDKCFSPKAVVSPDKYGNVTWEEPIFSDNSGEPLQVVKTHTPGWFSMGKTNVTYTAIDKSGNNNTCVLEINVIPHPCEFPEPPVNGNRTCFENDAGVICKIFCMEGYAFAIPPAPEYFCAYDDMWKPEDQMPFPDCSVKHTSNDLVQEAKFKFTSKLSCRDQKLLNTIKGRFERKVTNRINEICVGDIACGIHGLETTCEEDEDFNKVKFSFGRRKRSVVNPLPRKTFLTFDFSIEGSIKSSGKPDDDKTSQKKLEKTLKKVVRTLQNDAKDGEFDILTSGKKIFFNGMELDSEDPKFQCPDGQILIGSDCVNCPVGTFFNVVKRVCESCFRGNYQEKEGSITCFVCPNKTSTSQNNSKSQGECLAQCLPGSFSESGLERCETCDIGWYQPQYAQTNCTLCPPGLTTPRRGSRTRKDCKEICPRGYVSKNGLEPCFACPRGTFQPDIQKSGCFECPNNATTYDIASVALTDCEGNWNIQNDGAISVIQNQQHQLAINKCFENPCFNGGTCIPKRVAFTCNCPPGFGGLFCKTVVDECQSKPCLNNGSCVTLTGDYRCDCITGFTGKKCEKDIDDCLSSPCLHKGTCIDGPNSYVCNCPVGYTGVSCENDVNDCTDRPCRNGGTCTDKPDGFECQCPQGFNGVTCEIEEDECLSHPCRNNGTCVDSPGDYSCICVPGYTGKRCGRGIDDCKSNPCLNGGKCEDLINAYQCHCTAEFRGAQCQTSLDVNYQLDFAAPGIVDNAQFRFPDPPLNSLTVTFWMKSDDTLNFGTPYSYAVPGSDNAFTLTDYNGFVVLVNQEKRVTDLEANDGLWHHIVVTWSSNRGAWKIYKDGLIIDSGWDLSTGRPVPGGGMFIIGQEQDVVGGEFSTSESFVGSLTHLNVWDDELPLYTIEDMRITCNKYLGNVLAWPDVYKGLRGTLSDSPSTFCQDCPLPAKPDFGSVAYTDVSAGSSATFSCLRGFNVAGMNDQLCLATGHWEEEPPICAKVECGFPGNIQNGYTEGRRYSFDNRVRYHCHKGYQLVGSKTRYCNEYGEWEGDKPQCVEITCDLPLLSVNTLVKNPQGKYRPRNRVEFTCTPGNVLFTTHDAVICQTDGTWDKSVPTCDMLTCSSAPDLDNGYPINKKSEYSVGQQVSYECNFGFTFSTTHSNNKGKVTCLPSGSWETDLPVCEKVTCPAVPMVANANVSGSDILAFSVVEYRCHVGYSMVGDDTIECYENGEWTPGPPECRPVNCGEPLSFAHGSIQGFSYQLNDVLSYKCDPGYRLNGESRRTCLETGFWSGEERVCNPVSCDQPNPITNGKIEYDGIDFQSTLNYTCDEGYELVGTRQRSCLETRQWSQAEPDCLPVSCGPPPDLIYGNFKGMPPYVYGVMVSYYCNDGYEILGNTNLTCESTGWWNNVVPLCIQISCPPPQPPTNGFVNALGLAYTSKAEYECSDGHILEGVNSRTCQIDKTWTDTVPICKPSECEPPVEIQNGRVEYKDLSIGAIATYTCELAHRLVGDKIRRCLDSLTWSGQAVMCKPVQCPDSFNVPNGRVEISGTSFGSLASYICDVGYNLNGDQDRVCDELGVWSGSSSSCLIVDCDKTATVISNGKMIGNKFTYGSVIRYECDDGYTMLGSSTRTCESNGEWDQPLPVCQVVQCPSYILANGYVDGFKRDYGSTVTYSCRQNFRLEGPSSRTCLSGGVWGGADPICVKIVCPQITNIAFGSYVTIDSRNARYHCDDGFNLVGQQERFCEENGTWSGTEPYCDIIQCPDLSSYTIPHGSLVQNSIEFGSLVDFLCDDGYQLIGSTGSQCLASGAWSHEFPRCTLISCGEPGAALNAKIIGSDYTFGAVLNYTCLDGFKMVGDAQRRCGLLGQWEPGSPRCETTICPDLNDIDYGIVTILGNTFGGSAVYKCVAGYEIFGLDNRMCLASGEWEDQDPICAPIHCHHPHALKNGQITGTDYHFEKEIVYKCNEGYNLRGNSVRLCQANRRWSGKKPTCDIIRCEDPARFQHGRIEGGVYTLNNTITYICHEGYLLVGESTRLCTINSVWNTSAPRCERISCGQFPVIANAVIRGTETLFNTSNVIECNKGYTQFGDPTITCLSNASWSVSNFRCNIVQCPPIYTIQQGAVLGSSFDYDIEIYFTCNIGYDLEGEEALKCLSSGNWDYAIPYCIIVPCPDITVPAHGKVNATSGAYGDDIEYTCKRGYELIGGNIRRCLDYGDWDILAPYCQIISCPPLPKTITNGRLLSQSDNYTFNSSVEFECNNGYEMIGNSVLTCRESGMWDSTSPYCIKINCPPPGGLLNGQILGTEDLIEYVCNAGYNLIGSRERRCTNTGQWDADAPFCAAVSCPPPEKISNGVILGDNFTFGFQIQYLCHLGYNIIGTEQRTCLALGSWDNQEPACEVVSCGSPRELPNGKIIGRNFTYGQIIQYVCDDGYILNGEQSRRCTDTGSWTSGKTVCERVTCPLPHIQNGFILNSQTSFYGGTAISIECVLNYRLSGSPYIECLNNGTIYPNSLPICNLITCPEITSLENGRVIGSDFTVGRQIEFVCDPSHQLDGEYTLDCLADGTWNFDIPVCQENFCPTPSQIPNGKYFASHNFKEYRIYDRLTIQCNDGYEVIGETQIMCQSDATWSHQFPSCVPVDCGRPQDVLNGQLVGISFKYLDQISYTCNPGYKIKGGGQLECGDDGSWVGAYPTCVPICGQPPDIPNASVQVSSRGSRKTARYTCANGYYIIGDPNAICDQTGQWTMDNSLSCDLITCPNPTQINHGLYLLNQRVVGSVVTYSCDLGYNLVGLSTMDCRETGEWHGVIPRCDPVYCGPPQTTTRYSGDDFTFGREVHYECDEGHTLQGYRNLICQANGEWSGLAPTCQRKSCGPLTIPLHSRVISGDPLRNILYNDTVVYECHAGYVMEGIAELKCLANGRWNGNQPICQLPLNIVTVCDDRVNVKNSAPFITSYIPGERATVNCKIGYHPRGNMDTTCKQDNTWTVPSGRCRRVFCGRPRVRDIVNIVIQGFTYFYNDRIQYMCRPGLRPIKFPPILTCKADGRWDGEAACAAECKLPCQNGGMCIGMNRCKCRPGFGGIQCEKPICILPCLNGGVCSSPYRCSCPKGYRGSRCESAICQTPCENGGKCMRPGKCKCYNGFIPPYCKTKVIDISRRR